MMYFDENSSIFTKRWGNVQILKSMANPANLANLGMKANTGLNLRDGKTLANSWQTLANLTNSINTLNQNR